MLTDSDETLAHTWNRISREERLEQQQMQYNMINEKAKDQGKLVLVKLRQTNDSFDILKL